MRHSIFRFALIVGHAWFAFIVMSANAYAQTSSLDQYYQDGTVFYTVRTRAAVCGDIITSGVFDQAGTELFRTVFTKKDYANGSESHRVFYWLWLTTMQSDTMDFGPVSLSAIPTLQDSNLTTYLLFRQIPQSPDLAPMDTTGCTYNQWNSCSDSGICCDIHDQCYYDNHCTASSWFYPSGGSACSQCNFNVVDCFMRVQSPLPHGPSSCCLPGGHCGAPVCLMHDNIGSYIDSTTNDCVWTMPGEGCGSDYPGACGAWCGNATDLATAEYHLRPDGTAESTTCRCRFPVCP